MRRAVLLALTACGRLLEAPSAYEHGEEPFDSPDAGTEAPTPSGVSVRTAEYPRPYDAGSEPSVQGSDAAATAPAAPAPESPDPAPCALVTHHDGLGRTYASCAPLRTYDEAAARLACLAHISGIAGASCVLKTTNGTCANGAMVSISTGVGTPAGIWDFAGPHPGRVVTVTTGPSICPTEADLPWD